MINTQRVRRTFILAALFCCLGLLSSSGQFGNPAQNQGGVPAATSRGNGNHDEDSPARREMEEKQAHARNDERQKRIIADSEKLLALATQLHEDVLKTDKNILSMDVMRRAQEMEKLSRDLKERMKG